MPLSLIPFLQSFVLFHLRSHFQKFLAFFSQTFQLFSSDFFRFRCSRFRLRLNDVRAVPARTSLFNALIFDLMALTSAALGFESDSGSNMSLNSRALQIREFLRYGARRGGGSDAADVARATTPSRLDDEDIDDDVETSSSTKAPPSERLCLVTRPQRRRCRHYDYPHYWRCCSC